MKLQRQIEALQAQRASEWYELLKHGRPEHLAGFQAWCRKSPLHIEEFLKVTWTDQVLEHLDPERSIDIDALLRDIPANVHALRASTADGQAVDARSHRRVRRWHRAVAAAVGVLAIGAAAYWHVWRAPEEFSTQIGELRTVALADASVVTLNTDSDIQVQFERDARNIELRHGEAIFRVAHDSDRPFRVHTRAGTAQAIGTQFNVYAREDGTDVAVMEGRVRLTARDTADSESEELAAGEQARILFNGHIRRAERADVERTIAWSTRRLKFDETPLEEMVHEFNRYQRNVRLRVEGIPARSHHYSGIFDADDPEMLATLLANEPDLDVEHRDGEIIIRAKPAGGGVRP